MSSRPTLHIAAALIRRGEEVALVRQGAPGEEPFLVGSWRRDRGGELVPEGLAGELHFERWHEDGRIEPVAP